MSLDRIYSSYEKEIRDKIKRILDIDGIDICFIFGSFCTDEFTEDSDFDIAILGDIDVVNQYRLSSVLDDELGRQVDLVRVNDLPKIIQLQITNRSDILFCKNNDLLDKYYEEVNIWYKTEFRLWKAWQEEEY